MSTVEVEVVGRRVAGLGHRHRPGDDITVAPMVRGEVALGLATHYLTGVALTETYLVGLRRLGLRNGPIKATAFGLATAVLPLFVMYPSMGYGCCGRDSGDARRVNSIMLLGHAAFGAGIGLWTATRPRGSSAAAPAAG